ncbi:Transcriptional regulator, AbrB family [Solimicrobium silvestre]|uniref:Transcriptional regulator, AbrB family n=2 Tax=Solimicrobium silvestre TaxID=2099400 RepID=A0A2S9GV72_9BURK|nr:AbrB/MazE/SpoVT family DNA-binding domain-containing protein [Solimicrobium silvestre]PRC91598.1 Transcriptional regulator, AbrB family [Solimicrobium silvestre]
MTTATMTTKGQITIPAPIRAALGLEAGSRIEFIEIQKGQFAIIPATSPVLALKGMLHMPEKPITIEAMNQAIAAQAAKAR